MLVACVCVMSTCIMSIGRVNRSIHDLQGMFVSTTRVQQRLVMKHLLLEVTLKLLLLDGEVQKPRCPALAFHGVFFGYSLEGSKRGSRGGGGYERGVGGRGGGYERGGGGHSMWR